ncbi:MAG: RrF2 family transcriptional regulator [Candidatus Limnocylindrales bacterium]
MRLELTRRGDYAVRAAIALAAVSTNGLLSTRRIAAEMQIPPRFLPQVMADLARAELVVAQTGRSGGYRLARPAAEISLLEVIHVAEHEHGMRTCVLRGGPCDPDAPCDVHDVFSAAREALLRSLEGAKLGDVAEARIRRLSAGPAVAPAETVSSPFQTSGPPAR